MKKSKVVSCEYVRSWSNANGQFHTFSVTFENGDSGQYNSKNENQNKFVVGKESAYEIHPSGNDYPDKIKPVKDDSPAHKEKVSNASFALSYAKDWAIANIEKGNAMRTTELLIIADTFKKWLDEN